MSDLRDWVAARAAHDLLRHRLQREIILPSPSAGAEWSTVVPAGITWQVLSAFYLYTASAVVATRVPMVFYKDADGNTVARHAPAATITAGSSVRYSWIAGLGDHFGSGVNMQALASPDYFLVSGWSVGSVTAGIDVGDTYTQLVLLVREWSAAQVGQHLEKILGDEMLATYADREV